MKALSVLVSVALCVLLASDRASADPAFSLAYEPETFVSSARLPTLDQTCAQVGDMSGCSGCVHGTKGLCGMLRTFWTRKDSYRLLLLVSAFETFLLIIQYKFVFVVYKM